MTNIHKQVLQPSDMKFRPGESVRMMNRAVASHTFAQTAMIQPYTEDINTLKVKHKVIRSFADDLVKNPYKHVGSTVKGFISARK